MRRLPFAFLALLGGASLVGLGIAWGINVALYGRPHGALLELITETAAAGIDCAQPERSPFFQKAVPRNLSYVLVDAEGHRLGEIGHIPPGPLGPTQSSGNFFWREDNPWRANNLWVKVPNICGQNWTLWALDPNNEVYRHLLLPRQIILVISCSSSIIFVVLLVFAFVRRKGRDARQVLSRIRDGEFGSRIPQNLWEPRLQLISEFNRMAAAVEDSFLRLHRMEERRARLLSELAHDIRTPLASVRAAAETLSEFQATMTEDQRRTLQNTLLLDVLYFQSLIEDLLILAQIDRLDTIRTQATTDIKTLLPSVWLRTAEPYPGLTIKLEWPAPCPEVLLVPGDEQLVRRLLQNTLDNAFHYARTEVSARILADQDRFCLQVTNDADPLSEDDLQNWGHKRRQRIITEKAGQPHTSLGLGSSIIVGVSRHLGGKAWIEQTYTPAKATAQVSVFIDLPRPARPANLSD